MRWDKARWKLFAGCVCMALAAALMFWAALSAWPVSYEQRFTSTHPASTIAPLLGLSPDSLLNTGDPDALDELPGIGEVLAARIIELREQIGGFKLPEDLMFVKGIGEKTYANIMDTLDEALATLTDLR